MPLKDTIIVWDINWLDKFSKITNIKCFIFISHVSFSAVLSSHITMLDVPHFCPKNILYLLLVHQKDRWLTKVFLDPISNEPPLRMIFNCLYLQTFWVFLLSSRHLALVAGTRIYWETYALNLIFSKTFFPFSAWNLQKSVKVLFKWTQFSKSFKNQAWYVICRLLAAFMTTQKATYAVM